MAEEAHKYRYSVVAKLRTYTKAQRYCQEVLRGQLASVHSTARNQELLELARTYVHGLLWIGAVTKCRGGRWVSQWEDSSPWNYANWAPTNPIHLVATCATLSTFGEGTCTPTRCTGSPGHCGGAQGHW
ncbi:proteoglycan 3-like [Phalacrocorax aristotelis]|uniref:proteoglycan 3-like n=1 Tax=Phalacrocorax aristotelis TaxID=126867 RepID=UPI003F4C37DB